MRSMNGFSLARPVGKARINASGRLTENLTRHIPSKGEGHDGWVAWLRIKLRQKIAPRGRP